MSERYREAGLVGIPAGMAEQADAADSKFVGGNSMGVRFPLPAPSILFIISVLTSAPPILLGTSGTKYGTPASIIFNKTALPCSLDLA
jgi:hypothetical protein